MDFLAVHNAYTPVMIKKASFEQVYQAMLTFPEHVRSNINLLNQQIEQYAPADANRIKLAITEWGPFFAPRPDEIYLDHSKTLGSALSVAAMLQVFVSAPRLEVANFFKFIDLAFQGMVSRDGVPKPSYYALQMFTRHFGNKLVKADSQSPTYDFAESIGAVDPLKQLPYLTAVASLNESGTKAYIIAVNKHFHNSVRTTISLQGFAPAQRITTWTLTAPSLDANNGQDLPMNVGIKWPKAAKAPFGSMFEQGRPGSVKTERAELDIGSDRFEIVIPSKAVVGIELDRR
jgi:alpha-L-arabinofuranosidase